MCVLLARRLWPLLLDRDPMLLCNLPPHPRERVAAIGFDAPGAGDVAHADQHGRRRPFESATEQFPAWFRPAMLINAMRFGLYQ